MPTLRAPNGRDYHTDDDAEITNLTVGHGYTVVPDAPPPQQAGPRARSTKPTVEGETTD